MPIPLGVSARLANGQSSLAAVQNHDSNQHPGAWGQQQPWSQDSWGQQPWPQQSWGSDSSQQSWGTGTGSEQTWSASSQQQQPWASGTQPSWDAQAWGQALAAQNLALQGQEGQALAVQGQGQGLALQVQEVQGQALATQGQDLQSQSAVLQSHETPSQEVVPDASSQMPDLGALQQQQPASWTNAIFDQTARELWARLQEEGLSQEECVEQFQNHMVAVYTQMQTQQQYEAIAETNTTVTTQYESFQPKDPMEKLKPLFKGDEKEPHRTALGMDPLMKYYERSRNAPFGIFIGGLRTVTNEDVLVKYFSQFGEITFVEVKRLPDRTSRGFAFLHFENDDGVLKVLARKDSHLIDGKQVDCKRMEPMDSAKPSKKQRAKEAADAVSNHMNMLSSYQSGYSGYGSDTSSGWRSQPY